MKATRIFSFARVLVLAVSALGLSTALASAQSTMHGSFTLPVEAHWQKSVLPAGEYGYKVEQRSTGLLVTVHSTDFKWSAMFLANSESETPAVDSKGEVLVLTSLGGQMFVSSFKLGEMGVVANYSVPKELEHTSQPAVVAASTH